MRAPGRFLFSALLLETVCYNPSQHKSRFICDNTRNSFGSFHMHVHIYFTVQFSLFFQGRQESRQGLQEVTKRKRGSYI